MIIKKDLGLYRHTEEYEYTPSIEEMYFYYSGTHAGYTRDNPYYKGSSGSGRWSAQVTRRKQIKVKEK